MGYNVRRSLIMRREKERKAEGETLWEGRATGWV
jgi:hypothetical protein